MSNKYICFKSVIVISIFRLVTTGNRYGISKTDIWTIIPKQSTDMRVFPQTSINQDKQLHHGLTCNSNRSGSFQRRCAVNLTVGITMHAALLRNDFTNVKKKKCWQRVLIHMILSCMSNRSNGNRDFEPLSD